MKLIFAVLLALALCPACGADPEHADIPQVHLLSELEYNAAIRLGCRRGEKIVAGVCLEGGPCPMANFGSEFPDMSNAIYYACESSAPRPSFDTSDTALNRRTTAKEACEFYMRAYLLVVKGFEAGRAKVASALLCEYNIIFRGTGRNTP